MTYRSGAGHIPQLALVYGSLFDTFELGHGIDHISSFYRLPADQLGMIVDRGHDLPPEIHAALMNYGEQMWLFRNRDDGLTTRSLTSYRGEQRQLVCVMFSLLLKF